MTTLVRTETVEAKRWQTGYDGISQHELADKIVFWVKTNGGEARYDQNGGDCSECTDCGDEPRIAVRTINGWVYAAPGDYVVEGQWFGGGYFDKRESVLRENHVREFKILTFEQAEREGWKVQT